jgi:hypothetical protein
MTVNLALERRYYSSPNLQDSSEHIHNTRSIHICRGNGGKGETIRFIHANDKIGNISSTHIQHIISTSTPEALEKYLESLVLSPKILVELIETRRRNPMSPQLPTPAAPQYTSRPTTSTTQSKTSSDQMGPHATLVSPDSSIFMTALAVERVLDSPVVKTVWIGPVVGQRHRMAWTTLPDVRPAPKAAPISHPFNERPNSTLPIGHRCRVPGHLCLVSVLVGGKVRRGELMTRPCLVARNSVQPALLLRVFGNQIDVSYPLIETCPSMNFFSPVRRIASF